MTSLTRWTARATRRGADGSLRRSAPSCAEIRRVAARSEAQEAVMMKNITAAIVVAFSLALPAAFLAHLAML